MAENRPLDDDEPAVGDQSCLTGPDWKSPPDTALSVVVVTHNSADHLARLLTAVLGQLGEHDELLVVDNLSDDGSAAVARDLSERVTVIESGSNLGFAGGCHVGVDSSTAPLLLFLNPDSVAADGCLEHLRAAAAQHPSWGAWQAAVMMPDGRINSDGGVIHYLGLGWAGDCGRAATHLPTEPREVAFPSGAALVVRRAIWDQLGGLDESYFLYCEDLDLGARLWLAGYRVGLVPGAVVVHDYAFNKGKLKWYWLERNRWRTVLAVYPASLLLLVAPALIAMELGMLLVSAREGWLMMKMRAQLATVATLPALRVRRRSVQATRTIGSAAFASHLTASLDTTYLPLRHVRWAVTIQRWYWAVVVWLLSRAGD